MSSRDERVFKRCYQQICTCLGTRLGAVCGIFDPPTQGDTIAPTSHHWGRFSIVNSNALFHGCQTLPLACVLCFFVYLFLFIYLFIPLFISLFVCLFIYFYLFIFIYLYYVGSLFCILECNMFIVTLSTSLMIVNWGNSDILQHKCICLVYTDIGNHIITRSSESACELNLE